MITAIITQLKTGSITGVFARGDGKANLIPPYILVWEDVRIQLANGQALGGFFVSYHDVIGKQDFIDDYMNGEVTTLLHKITLTDSQGNNFRLEDTNELSILIQDNDDKTLSKDRLFSLPKLGAV